MKNLNERATLFKITSNAMINACTEFMELTQTQGQCRTFPTKLCRMNESWKVDPKS